MGRGRRGLRVADRVGGKALSLSFVHFGVRWIVSNHVAYQPVWFRFGRPPGGSVSAVLGTDRPGRPARPMWSSDRAPRRGGAGAVANCKYPLRRPFGLRTVSCVRSVSSGLSDSPVCRVSDRDCGYRGALMNCGRIADFGDTSSGDADLGDAPPVNRRCEGVVIASGDRISMRHCGVRTQQRLPQEADRRQVRGRRWARVRTPCGAPGHNELYQPVCYW